MINSDPVRHTCSSPAPLVAACGQGRSGEFDCLAGARARARWRHIVHLFQRVGIWHPSLYMHILETVGLKYLNDSRIWWYSIMEVIDEVASALKMDRDVLARASIKAFLEKELRCIEAEIFEIRTSMV